MVIIVQLLFLMSLIKLSWDDLSTHQVYHIDLFVVCCLGLVGFQMKPLDHWLMMVGLIGFLGLTGHLSHSLGSGDLPVILALGLTMRLSEWLNALSCGALIALLIILIQKKGTSEEVPFVPYLSLGWLVIYLIRLRLIFS